MRGIERTGVSDGDTFRSAGISADALKWIALLTMLCDHVGAVLLPQYPILRLIGRTAFPLFVWLLVEGFSHTSSRKRYLGRMAAFAILSELPFDLALYGRPDWQSQNVFVTLSIGLQRLIFLERAMDEWDRRREAGENAFWQAAEACGIAAAAMVAAELLRVDYGGSGPLLAALFYCYARKKKPGLVFSFLLFCLSMGLLSALVEVFGIVSVPLIARYNGIRKRKKKGRLFYLFYPVHLLILYLIHELWKNVLA